MQAIEGFEQALALRRVAGDDVEFLVLTLWASQDAIHAFAGQDAELAVIPQATERVLKEWDDRARHFELALAVAGQG